MTDKLTVAGVIASYMANYMPGDAHADYARRLIAAARDEDSLEVEHLLGDLTTAAAQITLEHVSIAAARILLEDAGEIELRAYLPELGWDPEDPDGLAEVIIAEARGGE